MSVKKNTISNYISQIYVIVIGVIILPFYLKYLGPAAYGIVGIFAVIQTWLRLLDMGLTPTLARQVAYTRGKNQNLTELVSLLRSLESLFLLISVFIMLVFAFASHYLAQNWLQLAGSLAPSMVAYCITIMGMTIGLRWLTDLYVSGIRGMEDQLWLNIANVLIASLQSFGALALLHWVSHNPIHFFEYQLAIGLLNLLIMRCKLYQLLSLSQRVLIRFSWPALKAVLPFAGATAYTSGIWIIITQFDKLLLSHILPISEYGYFAIITAVSGALLQLVNPISFAILPRMTYLLAKEQRLDMLELYHKASQLMAVIIFSVSGILICFPSALLYAWTGNAALVNWGSSILVWYVLGNGILTITSFQYYLQYAHGKLRLHVAFNTTLAIIMIPLVLFAAYHFGAIGTAVSWGLIQLLIFLIYPIFVHRQFAPGIHLRWLFKDILPILISTILLCFTIRQIPISFLTLPRLEIFILLCGFGLLILGVNALVSDACRHQLWAIFKSIKGK